VVFCESGHWLLENHTQTSSPSELNNLLSRQVWLTDWLEIYWHHGRTSGPMTHGQRITSKRVYTKQHKRTELKYVDAVHICCIVHAFKRQQYTCNGTITPPTAYTLTHHTNRINIIETCSFSSMSALRSIFIAYTWPVSFFCTSLTWRQTTDNLPATLNCSR